MYASPQLRPNPRLNEAKNLQAVRHAVAAAAIAFLVFLAAGGLFWWHYFDARPDPTLELAGDLWPEAHDRTWELLHRSRYWTAYFDHHTSAESTVEVEIKFDRQPGVKGSANSRGFVNAFCTVFSLPERRKLYVGAHQQRVSSVAEKVEGLTPEEAAVEEAKFESLTRLKNWLDCGALHALAEADRRRFEPLIREASRTPGPLANEAKAILARK